MGKGTRQLDPPQHKDNPQGPLQAMRVVTTLPPPGTPPRTVRVVTMPPMDTPRDPPTHTGEPRGEFPRPLGPPGTFVGREDTQSGVGTWGPPGTGGDAGAVRGGPHSPLRAAAGITSDILGRDVLLWLMAGSSRWSWGGHALLGTPLPHLESPLSAPSPPSPPRTRRKETT